jgi:hypothetical protein
MDDSTETAARLVRAPLRAMIYHCPAEILLEIFRNLGNNRTFSSSRKDYYNLCLIKPFHAVATELLYFSAKDDFYPSSGPITFLLLRTLLVRPELGLLIREFHALGSSGYSLLSISEADKTSFRDAIMSVGLREEDQSRWINLLDRPDDFWEVCVVLILMRCPNIITFEKSYSSLYAVFNDSCKISFWTALFHPHQLQDSKHVPIFANMKRIRLCEFVTPSDLVVLFRLPALAELSITGLRSKNDHLSLGLELFAGTSNIKKLEFADGYIHPHTLVTMVSACKALSSFSCTDIYYNNTSYYNHFSIDHSTDLAAVVIALFAFRDTLRHLEVTGTDLRYNHQQRGTIARLLPQFTALEDLRLDANLLLPNDKQWPRLSSVLPRNLKQLEIRNAMEGLYGALTSSPNLFSELLTPYDPALPLLQKLKISIFYASEGPGVMEMEEVCTTGELGQQLSARGLTVEIWDELL